MLRRRHKSPKVPKSHPHDEAPRSRRRARPDARVPSELIVPPRAPAVAREAPERTASPRAQPARASAPEQVVLVTGFEPFAGEAINPSWTLCGLLPRALAGMRIETCRVPCEFRRAIEVVASAIEHHRPAIVLCLGQAGGRTHLGVERVAINVDDAQAADNVGATPVDEPIASNGPPAYFATLPIKAMVAEMQAIGVPAEVSNSAGTFVCNHLMYGVLHYLAASGNRAQAGFIHLPYAEEQVIDKRGIPAMAITTMLKGVEAAIAAAHRDLKIIGGTLG